jgi:hypothetical protein
MYE